MLFEIFTVKIYYFNILKKEHVAKMSLTKVHKVGSDDAAHPGGHGRDPHGHVSDQRWVELSSEDIQHGEGGGDPEFP